MIDNPDFSKYIPRMWPNFPSFTVKFNDQQDFNRAISLREAESRVDVSWSERIVNFDDKDNRTEFIAALFFAGISDFETSKD